MGKAKGSKNAKFKSGIGLEMFQMLLDILEREYQQLEKGLIQQWYTMGYGFFFSSIRKTPMLRLNK